MLIGILGQCTTRTCVSYIYKRRAVEAVKLFTQYTVAPWIFLSRRRTTKINFGQMWWMQERENISGLYVAFKTSHRERVTYWIRRFYPLRTLLLILTVTRAKVCSRHTIPRGLMYSNSSNLLSFLGYSITSPYSTICIFSLRYCETIKPRCRALSEIERPVWRVSIICLQLKASK